MASYLWDWIIKKRGAEGWQGPSYGAEAKKDEFWKTEDYFEKMVWRNYVEQHADLFEDGNVEGEIDKKVCGEREIAVQEAMNVEMG